jgi:ATP-dependent helicase/nuclease subunit A
MSRLADARARERIRTDTESTLFVEAGAGSGKTKSLVDRVTTLVLVDGVRMADIAAVTFTEKAGAELRDRLRAEFEVVWRRESGERERLAEDALADLDSAAIGTLHSFAQRILTMFPIEAGLPPLVEVLDEVASSVAFEERWSVMQRELLDDADLSESLLLALSAGVKLEHLRSLARAFGNDWDLIEDKVLPGGPPDVELPEVGDLAEEAARLADRADECWNAADKFLPRLQALREWGEQLHRADEPGDLYAVLLAAQNLKWGWGSTKSWPDLDGVKEDCRTLQTQAARVAAQFADATLRPLAYRVAERVRESARERAAEGRLEFHDLLVLARGLLRERADVRAALQRQWPRLLLDEFQDTDPIQIELAVRIAGGADAGAADWRDVEVPPGSLFVVGDPKQSIYRFRRASIETYLSAQDWVDQTVQLTTNFRTVAPVLGWVNEVFGSVITYEQGMQPGYEPLDTHRSETGEGPPVVVLGKDAHDDKPSAAVLREREAADVAAVVAQALREGWTVWEDRREEWRPLRLGDVAILVPARTSLPFLEDALDRAGLSYRAESSSLVYQAGEVRDLMAAARAVADPSDLLSCVTALRSPLFGCGDDDLWTWKQAGGSFNVVAPIGEERRAHPVGAALRYLQRLHYESRWMTPSEVLGALVADRRMLEVAATGPRARDQWRRLRFVVDQARAWSEVEHGGLRAYLAWAARQGEETSRVAEAVLPETDVDAVRIMTVHAAKGLEFPMVVLSGMSSQARGGGGVRVLWTEDGYEVRLTRSVQTNDFENVQPLDEQMDDHERKRLLYVATTRARDHLAVSLHRADGKAKTNARLLAEHGAGEAAAAVSFPGVEAEAGAQPVRVPATAPPEWEEWLVGMEAVRWASRAVPAVSASGLEGTEPAVSLGPDSDEQAGSAKGGRDVELPPWSKGRFGSAIGRAVHGVLQVVDLATGEGLDDAVSAQCVAEGVVEYADLVRTLVRSALDSDVVRRAAQRPHWRESYVGMAQDDGTVLEGFVDLMYREDDGTLVIVDYKTDAVPQAALTARSAYYRPQMDAYRTTVGMAADGGTRTRLLFLDANHKG